MEIKNISEIIQDLYITTAQIEDIDNILEILTDYLDNNADLQDPISCWNFVLRRKEYLTLTHLLKNNLCNIVKTQNELIEKIEKEIKR